MRNQSGVACVAVASRSSLGFPSVISLRFIGYKSIKLRAFLQIMLLVLEANVTDISRRNKIRG